MPADGRRRRNRWRIAQGSTEARVVGPPVTSRTPLLAEGGLAAAVQSRKAPESSPHFTSYTPPDKPWIVKFPCLSVMALATCAIGLRTVTTVCGIGLPWGLSTWPLSVPPAPKLTSKIEGAAGWFASNGA